MPLSSLLSITSATPASQDRPVRTRRPAHAVVDAARSSTHHARPCALGWAAPTPTRSTTSGRRRRTRSRRKSTPTASSSTRCPSSARQPVPLFRAGARRGRRERSPAEARRDRGPGRRSSRAGQAACRGLVPRRRQGGPSPRRLGSASRLIFQLEVFEVGRPARHRPGEAAAQRRAALHDQKATAEQAQAAAQDEQARIGKAQAAVEAANARRRICCHRSTARSRSWSPRRRHRRKPPHSRPRSSATSTPQAAPARLAGRLAAGSGASTSSNRGSSGGGGSGPAPAPSATSGERRRCRHRDRVRVLPWAVAARQAVLLRRFRARVLRLFGPHHAGLGASRA